MNVPKLLRTALFSLLALVLTGGLMAVQAQDASVTVDQDDGDTIGGGLSQLDSQLSGTGNTAELIIVAGDYTSEGVIDLGDDNSNTSKFSELDLVIRADTKATPATEQLTLEGLELSGDGAGNPTDVNIISEGGNEFIQITEENGASAPTTAGQTPTGVDLILEEGTLNLGTTSVSGGVLRIEDGATAPAGFTDVFHGPQAEVTGEDVDYEGRVNQFFNTDPAGIPAGDIDSGGRFTPASLQGGMLFVDGSSSQKITITGDLDMPFTSGFGNSAEFNYAASDLEITGDFTLGGEAPFDTPADELVVGAGDVLTVGGTLTLTGEDPNLTDGNLTLTTGASSSEADLGNLTIQNFSQQGAGTAGNRIATNSVVAGPGTVTIGTLTVQGTDGGADQVFAAGIDATASSSDFTITDVSTPPVSDGSGTGPDSSNVDVLALGGGSVSVGGEIDEIEHTAGGALTLTGSETTLTGNLNNTGSGTVTVAGDVTYRFDSAINANPITNTTSATPGITVNGTLTVSTEDGTQQTSLTALTNDAETAGTGTIELVGDKGSSPDSHVITVSGSQDQVLPSVVANNALDIQDDGGARSAITVQGDFTSNAMASTGTQRLVDFGDGNSGPVTIEGGLTVNNGAVDFTNTDGATSPETTFQGDVDLNASPNGSNININAVSLRLEGDYDEDQGSKAELISDADSDLTFATNTDNFFSPGDLLVFEGDVEVAKGESTLTLEEALEIQGGLTVAAPSDLNPPVNTFSLEDNLILTTDGSNDTETIAVNSTIESNDNFLIVRGAVDNEKSFTRSNELGSIDNVRIENNSDIEVASDLEFTGRIELRTGGININATGGDDFFPEPGAHDAEIVRFLDATGTSIAENTGTFNDAGNGFDLTYTLSSGATTATANSGAEVTSGIDSLTVRDDAQVNLSNTTAATVDSALTVEGNLDNSNFSGGQIGDSGGDRTLTLTGGVDHTVAGAVGVGSNIVELEVTGDGASIDGKGVGATAADFSNDDATLNRLTVDAANVSVTDIQEVTDNVSIDSGGLTLALADDDGVTTTAGGTAPNDDGEVAGTITADGTLTLGADVQVTSSSASAVAVTDSLAFADSDLYLTNGTSGAGFDGDGDAGYSSSGGSLVFSQSSGATFGTAGVAVPRVIVDQFISLDEDAGTSEFLDVDANIALGSNDFEFAGEAELAANVTGSGTFRSVGTTLTVEDPGGSGPTGVARIVSNFEVDSGVASGNDTTRVQSDAPANSFLGHLAVTNQFTQTSGVLEYATSVNIAAGSAAEDFVYVGGELVQDGAYIIVNSENPTAPVPGDPPTFDINDDSSSVTIPNLGIVTSPSGDDQSVLLADDQDVIVSNDLVLRGRFHSSDSTGSVVIGDGARIARPSTGADPSGRLALPVYEDGDVFDEKPTFAGTYSLVYGNDGTDDFDSGFELDDASGTITSVTVDASDVYFESNQNRLTGDVTINSLLDLNDGSLDYGRQVVIGDGATVERTGDESELEDVPNSSTADSDGTGPDPLVPEGTYTLRYDGSGGFDADEEEFVAPSVTDDIFLEVFTGTGTVEIPLDRSVQTYTIGAGGTVTHVADGPSPDTASTVTVTDSVGLVSGTLGSGRATQNNSNTPNGLDDDTETLQAQDRVTITGGSVANNFLIDVEGRTLIAGGSVNGDIRTAGDVLVEQGANLALQSSFLEFDGTEQDFTLGGGPVSVGTLSLSQQNGIDGRVYLTGNDLRINSASGTGALDFNAGLLVVPDSVRNDVLVELSEVSRTTNPNPPGTSIPFTHDDDVPQDDSTAGSHIVGRVKVGVPSGAPATNARGRFEFPVGTAEQYRPAAVTFRTDDPTEISTNIVASHVPRSPQGQQGLPLDAGTDDDGNPVTIGQYPSLHWNISASTGLGPSQEFDLELETGTQTFIQEFEDASQLRIIRRADGDATENEYFLQSGDAEDPGEEYINNLISRNEAEFAAVRSQTSTGGISTTASLFTIGVPSDVAQDVDVAITSGGPGGLDRSFTTDPGDSDAPVGVFRLSPSGSGVTLDSLEIQTNATGTAGIDQMGLWASSDSSFSTSDDTELTTVNAGGAAPDSVVFDNLDNTLGTAEQYLFVTATLSSSAAGEVSPTIAGEEDLLLENGQITEVDGNEQSAFAALSLSSGASVLPVELANFEAERGDGEIRLQWSTASETNNAGFRIQRKVEESGTWETIGRRDGAGTTTEAQTYRFTDANLPFEADELTYRLRQVDLDGSAQFSDPLTVERSGPETVRLLGTAPNPVQSQARVRYAVPEEAIQDSEVRLELFDVMGRKVRSYGVSGESGRHEQMMQVNDLSSGVYFLRLRTGNTAKTRKLTIVR